MKSIYDANLIVKKIDGILFIFGQES